MQTTTPKERLFHALNGERTDGLSAAPAYPSLVSPRSYDTFVPAHNQPCLRATIHSLPG